MSKFFLWIGGFLLGVGFTIKFIIPTTIDRHLLEDSNTTLKEFRLKEGL